MKNQIVLAILASLWLGPNVNANPNCKNLPNLKSQLIEAQKKANNFAIYLQEYQARVPDMYKADQEANNAKQRNLQAVAAEYAIAVDSLKAQCN